MNLVLIGYRGTGKTTVAQQLARQLGWDWVDSDEMIESRAGCSIAEIFAQRGEPAFRDLETAVLTDLMPRNHVVIAVGGGVVVRPEKSRSLKKADTVVWLTARIETILSRVTSDSSTALRRPNLLSGGEDEVRQLLAERGPLYRDCATFEVETDNRTPGDIAAEIVRGAQLTNEPGRGINLPSAMPLPMRLLLVLVAAGVLARLANLAAGWLRSCVQPLGPHDEKGRDSRDPSRGEPSTWSRFVPVIGAWQDRGAPHSAPAVRGLRPLAVELAFPVALAALYWWEVESHGLVRALAPPGFLPAAADRLALQAAFVSHAILLAFMLVASLVDVDEQVIPDLVTLPGTLVGLALAAAYPHTLLPVIVPAGGVRLFRF